jgi:AbrB family looped-hinge helix DNA binding protein
VDVGKVDAKGRILIPANVRDRVGMEPGDVYVIDVERSVIRLAKAENPFDALAAQAIEEYRAGKTRSLRDYAMSRGIDPDGE